MEVLAKDEPLCRRLQATGFRKTKDLKPVA